MDNLMEAWPAIRDLAIKGASVPSATAGIVQVLPLKEQPATTTTSTGGPTQYAPLAAGEPVAWLVERDEHTDGYGERRTLTFKDASNPNFWIHGKVAPGYAVTPLYAHPSPQADGSDADKRDAERYRWLADKVIAPDYGDNPWRDEGKGPGFWIKHCKGPEWIEGNSLDAAIDAAMKATGEQK